MITYGEECWQLFISSKGKIGTAEMGFLRRPFRSSRLEHTCNEKIRKRKEMDGTIIERTEAHQSMCYGHTMRTSDER